MATLNGIEPALSPSDRCTRRSSCASIVASLDRKRLEQDTSCQARKSIRGVFDKETRRKPLAFAAEAGDAVGYGI
jgi:hypothetical protein